MLYQVLIFGAILISVCFLGVSHGKIYNFNQNQYDIRFSRLENEFWNKSVFKEFTCGASKISRDRFGINFTAHTIVDITAADKPRMLLKAFKFVSNAYRMKVVDMNEDFCDVVLSEHYGILPGLYKQGAEQTGCPLKADQYGIYNYAILSHKFPPAIPAGDYRLQYTLILQQNNVKSMAHQWSGYGKIIYRNKVGGAK